MRRVPRQSRKTIPAPVQLASPAGVADNRRRHRPSRASTRRMFPARCLHAGFVYAADYKAKRHRSRTAGPPQSGHDSTDRARRERDDGRYGAGARAAIRPVDCAMARHDGCGRASSHCRACHPLRAGSLAFPPVGPDRRPDDRRGHRRGRTRSAWVHWPSVSGIAVCRAAAPPPRALCIRRASRLFRAPREGAFTRHCRIAPAGPAGPDSPAFPVQQHQRGIVPRAFATRNGRKPRSSTWPTSFAS